MRQRSGARELHSWLLITAVLGAALVFGPAGGVDGIAVGKATIVVLSAIVASMVAGVAAIRAARIEIPWHPAIAATAILMGAMIIRVIVADDSIRAIVGFFGRWNGLALYLSCLMLFVVAAARGTDPVAQRFLRALVVGGIVVVLFALDEAYLGVGPPWGSRHHPAGTLGNSNFFGAWVACVLGPALALALDKSQPRGWTLIGVGAVPLLLWGAWISDARQALLVVALVLVIIGLASAADHLRRAALIPAMVAAVLAGTVGVALMVLGALGRGPLIFMADDRNVQRRLDHWRTAGRMIAEHPIGGIGPGGFTDHVRMFRSVEEAMSNPRLERVPGSVHNAPLQIFAEWGSLVGLLYVVVLVLVFLAVVRQLARNSGEHRLRYAALASVWLGYLLQSLVSIDTAQLLVLGWVAAGLLLAPTISQWHERPLPWRSRARTQNRPLPVPARWSLGVVLFLGLGAVWTVLLPLRADAASSGGEIRIDTQAEGGPPVSMRATEITPWESRYWLRLATVMLEQGEQEYVPAIMDHAYAISPTNFPVVLNAARVATSSGQPEKARDYYERALILEPHLPDLRTEVAEFAIAEGDQSWASELLGQALEVDPGHSKAGELHGELTS